MKKSFYTIGHSIRPLAEFVSMLQGAGVTFVVDVPTIPPYEGRNLIKTCGRNGWHHLKLDMSMWQRAWRPAP